MQSLVLDLALRLARDRDTADLGITQCRALSRAAARLADGATAGMDANVVGLAQQLLAAVGPV